MINVAEELATIAATLAPGAPRVKACAALMRRLKIEKAAHQTLTLFERSHRPGETVTIHKGHGMSAWEEIEKEAAALVVTGQAPTKEQAIAKVCRDNPALRQRYRTEPRPQVLAKAEPPVVKHWALERLEAMAVDLVTKGQAPTKAQGMVRAMSSTQGRQLATAYREHQRQVARG